MLIIIIAVMSGVMVPSYARFHSHAQFEQRVRNVLDLFSWARETAVQTSSNVTVRYDSQTAMFTVQIEQPETTSDLPTALQDPEEGAVVAPQPRILSLGEDMQVAGFQTEPSAQSALNNSSSPLAGAQQEVLFTDDGTSNRARLTLVSIEGYQETIDILPTTGRAILRNENDQMGN